MAQPHPHGASGTPTGRAEAQPRTPCSQAGSSGPIPWAELDPVDAWERLIVRLRASEDETLPRLLMQVGLGALADGVVLLVVPPGIRAQVEADRPSIEQALRDQFGMPFRIELTPGDPALPQPPSLALLEEQRRTERQAAVEREAREHRAIRQLVGTFKGRVVTVKPIDP